MGREPQTLPEPNHAKTAVFMAQCVHIAATVQEFCFIPLTRRRLGKRALAVFGPLALLWIVAYAWSVRSELVLMYAPVYLFASFAQTWFLRDRTQHTRFQGVPLFNSYFREACALAAAGYGISLYDRYAGWFVMAGGAAVLVKEGVESAWRRKLKDDLNDAGIDARGMYEGF